MKPFEFALCLWMIRPPMTGFDAEAEQASLEPGDGADAGIMIAEAMITEQFLRKAELAEGVPQSVPG